MITTDSSVLIVERTLDQIPKKESTPHCHPQGQFVLVRNGILYGYTAKKRWLMKPGMAVWIPPNKEHWGSAYSHVDLTVIYIPLELCANFISNLKLIDSSSLITAICERLTNVEKPLSEVKRHNMLQLLFEEIDESPISTPPLLLPQDNRLKKITDSLIENPAQKYSLAEWGKYVGATGRTLARLFKKETGLCYTEWHNYLLLTAAWKGLSEGDSNKQLSVTLGFSSGDSFSHWFRRVSGLSPNKARKQFQNYCFHQSS
ncbi:AraC family transcriptional regulator [Neisseria sp.]|uniref:AraC family transcriptional regulator n=1 Tax=Neisseria sp. TaxID=192066 RepID=UPI0026DD2335|nr:AraC family transcriptional regulator [Neisseria sp.]MDO4907942.1 AraC family transcriptional regulator [Neisseria sp.]